MPLPWRHSPGSDEAAEEARAAATWGLRARGRDGLETTVLDGVIDVRCIHAVSLWEDCEACAASLSG